MTWTLFILCRRGESEDNEFEGFDKNDKDPARTCLRIEYCPLHPRHHGSIHQYVENTTFYGHGLSL
jgi:hypothetical protein